MFYKIFLFSLFTFSLFAKVEVTNIIGGDAGNLDGIGVNAKISNAMSVAKSIDNQLIVGDKYGIKKVNISTNSISTIFSFNNTVNASNSVYDIEVDSSGNIYVAVSQYIDMSKIDSGCSIHDAFSDNRVYKLSPTGDILQTWGTSSCKTSPNDDFGTNRIYLAIDNSDVVYIVPSWTPDGSNNLGTKNNYIYKLNSDGTFSLYYDILTLDSTLYNLTGFTYHNSNFFVKDYSSDRIVSLNLSTNTSMPITINDTSSDSIYNITFDNSNNMILATSSSIKKVLKHNDKYSLSYILGNSYSKRTPAYSLSDSEVYSTVDALHVNGFQIESTVMIGDELYFSDSYNNRIAKLTFSSNQSPTLSFKDFPTEIKKGIQNGYIVQSNDSDGYVSNIYCDFNNGDGEKRVFYDVYGNSQSDGTSYITYQNDGNYIIECIAYDNEGLASTKLTKNIAIGTLSTTTEPITTPDINQTIGNITFLEYEPDGYFSWIDADKFCTDRGLRLPSMSELIYVWNENGGVISPYGFKKDTFYWSSDIAGSDSHQGCPMDANCSFALSWTDIGGRGHPKCVVSINGSLDNPTINNNSSSNTPIVSHSLSYSEFNTSYCGSYSDTIEGLKVNGSAYRYGNQLLTKKLYDVQDSITKVMWKANSSGYAQFSPYIKDIISAQLTTNHSFAESTKIDSNVWYYTTITIDKNKASIVTSINDYYTTGADVIDTKEINLSTRQLELSHNGVEIGFYTGDNYNSTNDYFIISKFETTAKVVTHLNSKDISLLDSIVANTFVDVTGSWTILNRQLQLQGGALGDSISLNVSNLSAISFKAISKQTQSNFRVDSLDKDDNIISSITIDPSTSACLRDYHLSLTKDVVKIKFYFTTQSSIEHYESDYKDVYIQDIVLYNQINFKETTINDNKRVDINIGDKNSTLTIPTSSQVSKDKDNTIVVHTVIDDNFDFNSTITTSGNFITLIKYLLDNILSTTTINIEIALDSHNIEDDGSSEIKASSGLLQLDFKTDTLANIRPNYSWNGKSITMPIFNSGSNIDVVKSGDDTIIKIKTKLTSQINFNF